MLNFLGRSKEEPQAEVEGLDENLRYGMYKNLSIGKISYVQPKVKGKRQHVLISSIEMTNIKDGLHRATMNRSLYVPERFDITSEHVGKWCLYGYYLWSNKIPGLDYKYLNIVTLKEFILLEDEGEANRVALEIMDSIKQIDYLKKQKK